MNFARLTGLLPLYPEILLLTLWGLRLTFLNPLMWVERVAPSVPEENLR